MNFTANPANGRFISRDTYRGELNDPGQWHLYVYCANNPINYVEPSGHWIVSIGFKAEAAYVFGGYVMIMGNYDGKHLLVTSSLGAKFVTNATASAGVSFATYTYKSVDKLLGWGATLGFNLAGTISGGISFDKNGNVGGSFGASYARLKTPKLAPFCFDFEFGYTKKIIKYKWNAIPKTKKCYKKYGLKFYVQRKANYVKLGSSKSKLLEKFIRMDGL
mgnify:CR=1 FL=1